MPWKLENIMSLRKEFVMLAMAGGINFSDLCKRFNISRKTGYKWMDRYKNRGVDALADRSKRPHNTPTKTPQHIEEEVLKIRDKYEVWGGRKIHYKLKERTDLQKEAIPAASTITDILRRNGKLNPEESHKHTAYQSFEAPAPNDLWQMDFKGDIALEHGRCYPLTILDDHSRYSLSIEACGNQKTETVKDQLIEVFRCFGLPQRMLMDNGVPWGTRDRHKDTGLTVWLMHLGIDVTHGRPYHPQTQGKLERFHKTLKAEAMTNREFRTLSECQIVFNEWRKIYNYERPHESLGMTIPGKRYKVSWRKYPEKLPAIEYGPGDIVRKVQENGRIHFKGSEYKLSKGFRGYPVAMRSTQEDGIYNVFFCRRKIAKINLIDKSVDR
jgi:transposase InsO family protein